MNLVEKYETLNEEAKQKVAQRIREHGADYGIYPLSKEEQGIWWTYCLEGEEEHPYYNIEFQIGMKKNINRETCEKAVWRVLSGQEACWYKFAEIDGKVYQYKDMNEEIDFSYYQIKQPSDRKEAEKKKLEFGHRRFDLKKDMPIRFLLIQDSEEEAELLVCIHHMICDGWSVGVFLKKFFEAYGNDTNDIAESVPYSNYVLEEISEERKESYQENLVYWKEKLIGKEDFLDVPTVFPRKLSGERKADVENIIFDETMSKRIHQAVKAEHTTIHAFLLTVYSILINRYTNKEEFLIGTPLAKRENLKYRETIGDFATTIALPLQLNGEASFAENLKQIQKELFEGIEHQNVTLQDLYSITSVQRREGINPLFQISFAVQSMQLLGGVSEGESFDVAGTEFKVLNTGAVQRDNFQLDFCFVVYDGEHSMELQLIYAKHLFTGERIKSLLAAFTILLEQVLEDSSVCVNDLQLCQNSFELEDGQQLVVDSKNRRLPCGFEGTIKEWNGTEFLNTGRFGCELEDGTIWIDEEKSDVVTVSGQEISFSKISQILADSYPIEEVKCILLKSDKLYQNYYIIQYSGDISLLSEQLPHSILVKPLFLINKRKQDYEEQMRNALKIAEIIEELHQLPQVHSVVVKHTEQDHKLSVQFETQSNLPLEAEKIQKIRRKVKVDGIPIGFCKTDQNPLEVEFYPVEQRNAIEDRIYHIWEEVLGISDFTIYDKFYEVGGNSMKAVKLFQILQKEFEKSLNIAQIFSYNTVHDLAVYYGENEKTDSEETEGIGF